MESFIFSTVELSEAILKVLRVQGQHALMAEDTPVILWEESELMQLVVIGDIFIISKP
uniref:Uncharacterized protein n=1 Tax=Arion vulgaris TaxID=1028688 RepID=A0A0B6ZN52_9EUPU